jgi:hypothetical protein
MTEFNEKASVFLLIVVALLTIGLGIPIGIITFKNIKFLNNSAVVNGVVQKYKYTQLQTAESSQRTDLRITVCKVAMYTVNGVNYTTNSTILMSESVADMKSIGKQIRIRYEKTNPANSYIDSWFEMWKAVVVLGSIWVVLAIPMVFLMRHYVINAEDY